jgi:hypothetical protein
LFEGSTIPASTLRELEGFGIVCALVDEQLLGTCMRYLKGIGFLPEPQELAVAGDDFESEGRDHGIWK